jgi:thioredoxin
MKTINCAGVVLATLAIFFYSCTNGQTKVMETKLTAKEFSEKIKSTPDAVVVDVRTPGEFSKGHLPGALNLDWNGDRFEEQMNTLDKSKPVFVYCLSGNRSSAAAGKMRGAGFSKVYELGGGILKWRAENLPEVTLDKSSPGMTKEEYDKLITDKTVVVDFYAEWCAPCKKMQPYLKEISDEMKDVSVVRINVDENPTICKELNVDALPVIKVYRNKELVSSTIGYQNKEQIVSKLKE